MIDDDEKRLMLNLMMTGETYLRQVVRYITPTIEPFDDIRAMARENFLEAFLAIVAASKVKRQ